MKITINDNYDYMDFVIEVENETLKFKKIKPANINRSNWIKTIDFIEVEKHLTGYEKEKLMCLLYGFFVIMEAQDNYFGTSKGKYLSFTKVDYQLSNNIKYNYLNNIISK